MKSRHDGKVKKKISTIGHKYHYHKTARLIFVRSATLYVKFYQLFRSGRIVFHRQTKQAYRHRSSNIKFRMERGNLFLCGLFIFITHIFALRPQFKTDKGNANGGAS